jgi:microcystin-dependent protein
MSQPFVGEIRIFAGNFAPVGWMTCAGQLLPISENETLFNLIGTTYGGDGQTTFALPDLSGRVPIHAGASLSGTTYSLGEAAGAETVALNTSQIPSHTHVQRANPGDGNSFTPGGHVPAASKAGVAQYAPPPGTLVPMHAEAIALAGGSQAHDNMMPYVAIQYIISLYGVFPPRS